jgi:probable HAF family extracellular repeat protein
MSATLTRWYSVNGAGAGDGSSQTSPKAYSHADITAFLNGSGPTDDVSVRFLAGTYVTQPIAFTATAPTQRRLRISGEGSQRSATILKLADNAAGAPGSISFQSVFFMNSYNANDYLDRLVISNLTFDCNWSGQGAASSPANVYSYKNAGCNALAKTGLIKNIAVQNYGSVGFVPVSWTQPAGAEAFPLMVSTKDVGQSPEAGFDHPWIIEDSEVSGFTGLHGGYCTAIHADVQRNASQLGTTPLIVVRRCQVRGTIPIAFGVTGGKVKIQDCVAADCGLGINNDTGQYRYCTYTNNLFLDVNWAANFGGHWWGADSWKDFNVSGNSIRLRGLSKSPIYQNFYTPNTPVDSTPISQSSLVLGRQVVGPSIGFSMPGAESDVQMINNRFTTWPLAQFNRPDPTNTGAAQFRAVWPMVTGDYYQDVFVNYSRSPQKNITFSNNKISGTAFDFGNFSTIPSETIVNYNPNDGTDEAAQHKQLRTALATPPFAFLPEVPVGRITLLLDGSGRLVAGREVALAKPTVSGSTVQVKARLAEQQTPLSAGTGTLVVSGSSLTFQVISGPNSGSPVAITTDTYGTATFTYTTNGMAGEDTIVAFFDEAGSTPSVCDLDRDAYSMVRHQNVTVVTVVADSDVAKDRPVVKAPFKIKRTGSLAASLDVKFSLPTTGLGIHSPATYGSTLDYTLNPLNGATLSLANANGTGIHTLTIPANQAEVSLEVVPRADDKLETEVVYLKLETNGTLYGLGAKRSADVFIYDGPKYNVVELSQYSSQASAAYAINHTANTPGVAGHVVVSTGGTPSYNQGAGLWTLPTSQYLNPIDGSYLAYPGNPTSTAMGVSDGNRLVGTRDGRAFRSEGGTSYTLLASLYASGATEAHGISPNGNFIVGNGLLSSGGSKRAVRWQQNATPSWGAVELGTFGGATSGAYGVNSNGQIVGEAALASGSNRAFRTSSTIPGGVELGLQPYDQWRLYGFTPPTLDLTTHRSAAYSIAASGASVGQADKAYPLYSWNGGQISGVSAWTKVNRACFWWSWPDVSGGTVYTPMYLGVMDPASHGQYPWAVQDSCALGINDLGSNVHEIVGWSHTTAPNVGGGTPRAFYAVVAPWSVSGQIPLIALNDEHLIHNSTGWVLMSGEGINTAGIIVGNGTYNGSSRGFALVPIKP